MPGGGEAKFICMGLSTAEGLGIGASPSLRGEGILAFGIEAESLL